MPPYYAIKRGNVNRLTGDPWRNLVFKLFRRPSPAQTAAVALYDSVVEQARQPAFYLAHGVPDTPDGRYDMIMVHAFLLLHRMKADRSATEETSQALFDLMFADLDRNLREMGAGDIGVAHRIKDMAKAFYGRIAAYENGLETDDDTLEAAIRRNIYRNSDPARNQVRALADYMRVQAAHLSTQATQALTNGEVRFGPPNDTVPSP